jgi:predicted nucleotidyltransferase
MFIHYYGLMNLSNSISAAIPSAHGPVLQELVLLDRPTTSAILAQRLKLLVGRSRVYEVVTELEESGLVVSDSVSGSRLISINKEHLAYPGLEALTGLRGKFIEKLQHEFGVWNPRPSLAYLFGSVAKNASNLHSDVDLLVIRPDSLDAENEDWARQLADLEVDITKWTGNQAQIVEHSQQQWRALTKAKYRLVSEIESSGIQLYPLQALES